MSKKRGFEVVSTYPTETINLPQRATKYSAGYDLEAAKDVLIPSIWSAVFNQGLLQELRAKGQEISDKIDFFQTTLVPTGVKAYMPKNEVLIVANRSSNPKNRGLLLPNGIGVIDADYYGNADTEGEIFVQLINYGPRDYLVKKGDRIAQAIFMNYQTADDEVPPKKTRSGGFGSSGQ